MAMDNAVLSVLLRLFGGIVAFFEESILKPLILWQFLLGLPFWLLIKIFAIVIGKFWWSLGIGTVSMAMAIIWPSTKWSRC